MRPRAWALSRLSFWWGTANSHRPWNGMPTGRTYRLKHMTPKTSSKYDFGLHSDVFVWRRWGEGMAHVVVGGVLLWG